MQRPPGWINADFATVEEGNKIKLAFTVDPMTEITDFLLEKKSGQAGTFQPLAQLRSANGSVHFTDENADTGIINLYRLSAINSCKIPVTVSNVCSNIVLSLKRKEDELHLSWNPYSLWLGSVSEYTLYINMGSGFEEKKIIAAVDTLVILDYSEIMYDVSEGEICFYVSAREISNPYGITGQSNSSVICTDPVELITVPNIFTPNNDLKNDLFKPVLSFTPLKYHLIISDQHGSVLFETRDFNETWNGLKNGKPLPDGLCLWFLRITTPSGNNISKTGTVIILKNP
jgi:gliding motility-associated-like protein